jgi:hypothetical protein
LKGNGTREAHYSDIWNSSEDLHKYVVESGFSMNFVEMPETEIVLKKTDYRLILNGFRPLYLHLNVNALDVNGSLDGLANYSKHLGMLVSPVYVEKDVLPYSERRMGYAFYLPGLGSFWISTSTDERPAIENATKAVIFDILKNGNPDVVSFKEAKYKDEIDFNRSARYYRIQDHDFAVFSGNLMQSGTQSAAAEA